MDENGGTCENVGRASDGLSGFLYLSSPVPHQVSADIPLRQCSKVSNGIHHLVVTVTDAAGNAATVLDRSMMV